MSLLGRKEEEEKKWKEDLVLPYENNLASDFSPPILNKTKQTRATRYRPLTKERMRRKRIVKMEDLVSTYRNYSPTNFSFSSYHNDDGSCDIQ